MTPDEAAALEHGLDFAARIVRAERPLTFEQDQWLYDGFLVEEISDRGAILALGLSFGQCLANQDRFEWVRIADEFGEETGLAYEGVTIFIHPITMIQKRLERKEQLSIEQLCQDTIAHLEALMAEGKHDTR